MLKKNKIFIFVILLFSFVILFATNSFADTEDTVSSSYTFTGPDYETYTVPNLPDDGYEHFIIVKHSSGIDFFNFSNSLKVVKVFSNGFEFTFSESKDVYTHYSLKDGEWVQYGDTGGHYSFSDSSVINSCTDLLSYIDSMNAVLDEDIGSDGASFFYNAPTVVADGVLAPIIQETGITGVLQEIVEILPVVLIVIVTLIAMRMAIVFLMKILRQA